MSASPLRSNNQSTMQSHLHRHRHQHLSWICIAVWSMAAVDSFLLPRSPKMVSKPSPLPSPSRSSLSVSLSSSSSKHEHEHEHPDVDPDPSLPPGRAKGTGTTTIAKRRRQGRSAGSTTDRPQSNSYLRWSRRKDLWEMQTAVTTFERSSDRKAVELHAQQHFGDAGYFSYWNSDERFNDRHDCVLYELLVDEELLEYTYSYGNGNGNGNGNESTGDWRVTQPIMASVNDRNFAQNLGLHCQASVIDYTQSSKWIHADMSRQEFQKLVEASTNSNSDENENETAKPDPSDANGNSSNNNSNNNTPLWKLAAPESSSTAAEAVAALMVGPPTLELASGSGGSRDRTRQNRRRLQRQRRLFTNLFLPGSRLASGIRAVLWTTVPAPELSVILLDWSSLLRVGGGAGSTGTSTSTSTSVNKDGNANVNVNININGLSEVALPILRCLVSLDIVQMRRFLLGQQVLVSSKTDADASSSSSSSSWSLLVLDRNDRALGVLKRKLQEPGVDSVALLYGSSHCPDLHNKLVAAGFQPTKKEWRTAWSVQESSGKSGAKRSSTTDATGNETANAPSENENDSESESDRRLPALGAFLVFYLIVGALDWVGVLGDTCSCLLDANYLDAGLGVGLYLLRHVLLYLGLSKFLIDWTGATETRTAA